MTDPAKTIIKYQLHNIDSEFECPLRDSWDDAAKDAEARGVGRWKNDHEFEIDTGNVIKAVRT